MSGDPARVDRDRRQRRRAGLYDVEGNPGLGGRGCPSTQFVRHGNAAIRAALKDHAILVARDRNVDDIVAEPIAGSGTVMEYRMFVKSIYMAGSVLVGLLVLNHAAAANPYNISDRCMPFYQDYAQATDVPKAFVAAKNGRCGAWHGASTPQEAKGKAMGLCQQYGGAGCRLVEHVDQ